MLKLLLAHVLLALAAMAWLLGDSGMTEPVAGVALQAMEPDRPAGDPSEPSLTPTSAPTGNPTSEPSATTTPTVGATSTHMPTATPTTEPTTQSTTEPTTPSTIEPTTEPTAEPTPEPTTEPTLEPTADPTTEPTLEPTADPTEEPTADPTPTITAEPTADPSLEPTQEPTVDPTVAPLLPGRTLFLPFTFRADSTLGPVAYRTMAMTGAIDRWDWEGGVAMAGLMYAYEATGDRKILSHVARWTDARLAQGIVLDHPNRTTPGWALAMLYPHRPREEYRRVLDRAVRYLATEAPRVEGGLAHHERQLWDDTLMNAVPLLARYGALFDAPGYLDLAAQEVLIHARRLQDPATGLWYHGWDGAAADPAQPHMSAAFWARGNAWAAVSATELLAHLPPSHPHYEDVRKVLDRQLRGLVGVQARAGLWHTVVNRPDFYLETSGSAGIGAAILRAARAGWIAPDLAEAGTKARSAARLRVAPDGTVTGVSAGTGVAPNIEMYNGINTAEIQPYGQGLYLMLVTAGDSGGGPR